MSTAADHKCVNSAKPSIKLLALLSNLAAVVVFCPHFFSWVGVVFFALLTFGTINLFMPPRKAIPHRATGTIRPSLTCVIK